MTLSQIHKIYFFLNRYFWGWTCITTANCLWFKITSRANFNPLGLTSNTPLGETFSSCHAWLFWSLCTLCKHASCTEIHRNICNLTVQKKIDAKINSKNWMSKKITFFNRTENCGIWRRHYSNNYMFISTCRKTFELIIQLNESVLFAKSLSHVQ